MKQEDWLVCRAQAESVHKAGQFKSIANMDHALVQIGFGRELGLSAMQSVASLHIIDGKPSLGVNAILELLLRGGVKYTIKENTDKACRLVFHRPGWEPLEQAYTIEDAKRAGLTDRPNWKKYTPDLLFARCVARGGRRIGADLLGGAYLPEEVDDGSASIDEPKTLAEYTVSDAGPVTDKRAELRATLIRAAVGDVHSDKIRPVEAAECKRVLKEISGYENTSDVPEAELDKYIEAIAEVADVRAQIRGEE
jgi:hypothetical protein